MFKVHRSSHNPIITPDPDHSWESLATYNGSPVVVGNKSYCLYRALSEADFAGVDNLQLSIIGRAETLDNKHYPLHVKFIEPEESWEKYGCEDPRVVFMEGKYYIFYTALSTYPFAADGIKSAVAISKNMQTIESKHLITPFNAKAAALFPEKVNGKYTVIITANPDLPPSKVAIARFDQIEQMWSENFWGSWYQDLDKHTLPLGRNFNDQVEVGAPPLKTEYGWLVIYSHIQNYYSSTKVFGIEAVLLDLDDPMKIIGRTEWPILVPEAVYEYYGKVPQVIFPSGALINGEMLEIFYGAADTTTCRATLNLADLLTALRPQTRFKIFKRASENPILKPIPLHSWESKAVLNPAAIDIDDQIHLLYRAMGEDNTSTIGYATTSDGVHIETRLDAPIYTPRAGFEQKHSSPSGNSGCEDPRAVVLGDKVVMTYVAYDGVQPPHVAMSDISVKDFQMGKWNWSEPLLLSAASVDDKDACFFPAKHNGKYLLLHRVHHHVCIDVLDYLTQEIDSSIELFGPRPGMWDSQKVGSAAPPILTAKGWLLLYHGISDSKVYMVGAVLLEKDDPTTVIGRTNYPLFVPETDYEMGGEVSNVVFPCGAIIRDNQLIIYYGGADKVVGMATADLDKILNILTD